MNQVSAHTHELLFSYGQIREHYAKHGPNTADPLRIEHFIRREHLPLLNRSLRDDGPIFTHRPNTLLQINLSPVSRQCLWELHSGIMLRLLENITGLTNLLPDTHCKQSFLLPKDRATPLPIAWHDANTGLTAALIMFLQLDTGDAVICRSTDSAHSINPSMNTLQITYWQHSVKIS